MGFSLTKTIQLLGVPPWLWPCWITRGSTPSRVTISASRPVASWHHVASTWMTGVQLGSFPGQCPVISTWFHLICWWIGSIWRSMVLGCSEIAATHMFNVWVYISKYKFCSWCAQYKVPSGDAPVAWENEAGCHKPRKFMFFPVSCSTRWSDSHGNNLKQRWSIYIFRFYQF